MLATQAGGVVVDEMADGDAAEKMLAEATLPPPSKIRKLDLELQAAQSSESEPIQEKKVAYLRDTELWDLLPTKSNKRLKANEPLEEGCAAPFVMELLKDLEKPLDPGRKEEILLKEIRLYLVITFLFSFLFAAGVS